MRLRLPELQDNATIPNNGLAIAMECLGMMEATPTLALSNQSLVWGAKNVLAQSDLDFVLTEYFKERLESRLKNRETHMDEDNSTEPNVLTTTTYLPVLIDWISSTNTFPPFYASSFSFISTFLF